MYELTKYEKQYIKLITSRLKRVIPYSTIWGNVCRQDDKFIEIHVNTPLLGTKTFYIYKRMANKAYVKSHVVNINTLYLRDSIIYRSRT